MLTSLGACTRIIGRVTAAESFGAAPHAATFDLRFYLSRWTIESISPRSTMPCWENLIMMCEPAGHFGMVECD